MISAHIIGQMDKLHLSLIPEITPGTARVEPQGYEENA